MREWSVKYKRRKLLASLWKTTPSPPPNLALFPPVSPVTKYNFVNVVTFRELRNSLNIPISKRDVKFLKEHNGNYPDSQFPNDFKRIKAVFEIKRRKKIIKFK